jgi:polyphosphate kinase
MRYFLSRFDYPGKDHQVVGVPDPLLVIRGKEAVGD